MPTEADPIVGSWYRNLDTGQHFEVVAVDEDAGAIEVQHYEGEREEIDVDHWYEMDLEVAEAPVDWSGPVDDIGDGKMGYTEVDERSDMPERHRRPFTEEWAGKTFNEEGEPQEEEGGEGEEER